MPVVKSILDVREMQAKRDTKGLIVVLEATNPQHIKGQAVAALGYLRDESAVPALIKVKENEGTDFQVKVIRTLGEIGGPVAFKHLEELSLKGENPTIQGAADEALKVAMKGLEREFKAQLIRQTPTGREHNEARWRFVSKEVRVTENDVFYMGSMKDYEGVARLLKHKDPEIRRTAVMVLSNTQDPAFIEPILSVLNDENEGVRSQTVASLRSFKDSRVVEALVNVASNKKEFEDIRLAAISSIRDIEDSRAVEPFIKILDDDSESAEIKMGVMNYLGDMKDNRAVPAVIKATYHEERAVKSMAIWALGETSSIDAFNHLVKLRQEFQGNESLLANVNGAIEKLEKTLEKPKTKGQVELDRFMKL
jgi:HEAT repeat protein